MKRARKNKTMTWLAALMALAFASSCGGTNYFEPASNKDSDDAVFEDVMKLVDAKSWDAALLRMEDLSSTARASFEGVRTEAGIHAGKCGLDFLAFAEGLGGSSSVFSLFMSGFTNTAVDLDECQEAQDLIEDNFGETAIDRSANLESSKAQNVNFFMAILGATKIGAQLRSAADADQDGTVDAGFDSCRAAAQMTPAQIIQVGTGFSLLLTNFSTIAATFGDSNAGAMDDLSAQCAAVSPNPCAITDPTASIWTDIQIPLVEPVAITMFRSLIQAQDYGVGSCSGTAGYPFDCCAP